MREVRRVQKLGKSTMMVSLPAGWVRNFGLKSGDVVIIEELDDGTLRVAPLGMADIGRERVARVLISRDSSEDLLVRSIYALYLLGYDKVQVSSPGEFITESHLRVIRNIVKYLIGAEVVEYTPSNLIIQVFIDPSKYSALTLIERMMNIVRFMVQHLLTAIEERRIQLLNEVAELEGELDRIYGLTVRQLLMSQSYKGIAKYLGIKSSLATEYRSVIKSIEDVGDVLAQVASLLGSVRAGVLDKMTLHIDVFRECIDTLLLIIDRVVTILEKPNLGLADDLLNLVSEFNSRLERYNTLMLKSLGLSEEYLIFRDLIDRLNMVGKGLEAVAETAFDISIESSGTEIDISKL